MSRVIAIDIDVQIKCTSCYVSIVAGVAKPRAHPAIGPQNATSPSIMQFELTVGGWWSPSYKLVSTPYLMCARARTFFSSTLLLFFVRGWKLALFEDLEWTVLLVFDEFLWDCCGGSGSLLNRNFESNLRLGFLNFILFENLWFGLFLFKNENLENTNVNFKFKLFSNLF